MVLLDVLAGWPVSVHDSRVLHNSSICLQANNRFPNDSLIRRWRISPFHVRSSSNFFTIYIHSLSYIHCFEFMHQWYLFHSRWLMTPFRDNGHLTANHSRFNSRFSSVRQTVERCNRLLKGRWRKLQFLDHLDMELMVLCIISTCVLHNFCLTHGDDDGGDGPGIALRKRGCTCTILLILPYICSTMKTTPNLTNPSGTFTSRHNYP